jgi:hypothetical protein
MKPSIGRILWMGGLEVRSPVAGTRSLVMRRVCLAQRMERALDDSEAIDEMGLVSVLPAR